MIHFLENNRILIDGYKNLWNNRNIWHSGLEINIIKNLCNNEVNNIIEFGSYDGGDGIRYKYFFPNANVYSIEASKNCYNNMKELENINKYNIKTFNYAISNYNGYIDFYDTYDHLNKNYAPCGSIKKNLCTTDCGNNNILEIKNKTNIPCITLDTFCKIQNIKSVDFAHIDVEGHAIEVIEGINEIKPKMIFIEVSSPTHNHSKEIKNLLIKKNYKIYNYHDETNQIWSL
jgi:FkbM family methyltransferase